MRTRAALPFDANPVQGSSEPDRHGWGSTNTSVFEASIRSNRRRNVGDCSDATAIASTIRGQELRMFLKGRCSASGAAFAGVDAPPSIRTVRAAVILELGRCLRSALTVTLASRR